MEWNMSSSKEMQQLSTALLGVLKGAKGITERIAGDTNVDYHDQDNRRIILPGNPEHMGLEEAAARLTALAAREAQVFAIHEQIPGLPYDAAYAFAEVIKRRYGWAETKSATKQGWFGPVKVKPEMLRVTTGAGPNDWIEVPMGDFELPDLATKITAGFESSARNPKMSAYYLSAEVKHSDRQVIMDLISETVKFMKDHSIYRGKAMRLRIDQNGEISSMFEPEFIDYSKIDPSVLVHPRDTQRLLDTGLFSLIRNIDQCRKHRVPLKRTVLLHGPYGTGKTLTAAVTAKVGLSHGWTFISVDNAKGLVHALEFAERYQPAIIFAEDIDRVTEERTEQTNDLLNVVSGILSSNSEVITVLTTNHLDKIHPAMLRPGRIDLVVPIGLPDAEAAERLIRGYAAGLLRHDLDIMSVAKSVEGFIPAMIRELVERAKLSMITDGRDVLSVGDLEVAALGLKAHASLLAPKTEVKSIEQKFGEAARKLFNGHDEQIQQISADCRYIRQNV